MTWDDNERATAREVINERTSQSLNKYFIMNDYSGVIRIFRKYRNIYNDKYIWSEISDRFLRDTTTFEILEALNLSYDQNSMEQALKKFCISGRLESIKYILQKYDLKNTEWSRREVLLSISNSINIFFDVDDVLTKYSTTRIDGVLINDDTKNKAFECLNFLKLAISEDY